MVNDLIFWLRVWFNFENVLLTFKWYVFMWQKCSMLTVCELPFLHQIKVCFNALKLCYDVSMNKTDSISPPPWTQSPPPPPSIFSCDQAALRTLLSVRVSVHPSVRPPVTPFSLCSHCRIIIKFSGIITNGRRNVHAKCQGQRSRSQKSWPHLAVSGL